MERFGTKTRKSKISDINHAYSAMPPNWTVIHECPVVGVNCNKCGKEIHYGKILQTEIQTATKPVKRLLKEETKDSNE